MSELLHSMDPFPQPVRLVELCGAAQEEFRRLLHDAEVQHPTGGAFSLELAGSQSILRLRIVKSGNSAFYGFDIEARCATDAAVAYDLSKVDLQLFRVGGGEESPNKASLLSPHCLRCAPLECSERYVLQVYHPPAVLRLTPLSDPSLDDNCTLPDLSDERFGRHSPADLELLEGLLIGV